MGRHDRSDGMRFDDDRDSAIAELLRRAYARKVALDTAARHLWAVDAAARSLRRSRRAARARRTLVAALTSLVLVATAGGAVAASGGALPGDALYPVKLGAERVRLVLAVTGEGDAQMHLAIARTRWDEAQRAAAGRPEVVPGLLSQMFAALDVAERRGGRVADMALALRSQVTGLSAELAFGPPGPAAAAPQRTSAGREPEHLVSPPASRTPGGDRDAAAGEEVPAGRVADGGSAANGGEADGGSRAPGTDAPTVRQDSSPPDQAPPPPPQAIIASPEAPPPEPSVPTPGEEDQPAGDDPGGDVDQPAPAPAREDTEAVTPGQPGPVPAEAPATEVEPPASSAPSAPGWGRPRP